MSQKKSELEKTQRLQSGASTDQIRQAPKRLAEFAARTLQANGTQRPQITRSETPLIIINEVKTDRIPFQNPSGPSAAPSTAMSTPTGTFDAVLCINGTLTNVVLSGTVGDPV